MKQHIILIGMPASGKTTLGLNLSKRLSMQFVDTDQMFEDKMSMTISEFWKQYDEFAFRVKERMIILECLSDEPKVIATGGGLPAFMDNMNYINQHTSIYLNEDIGVLQSRINLADRPILRNNTLANLYGLRKQYYETAKYHYNSQDSIEILVNNLHK